MDYLRTEFQANLDSEQEERSTISESGSCDSYDQQRPSFADEHGLMELLEGDRAYDLIYRNCKSALGDQCELLSILRNGFATVGSRAKLKAFQVFQEAVEMKHGGGGGGSNKARVKYGWCAVKKTELKSVLEYGFSQPRNDGSYGRGLYLSPDNALLEWYLNTFRKKVIPVS